MSNESHLDPWERGSEYPPAPLSDEPEGDPLPEWGAEPPEESDSDP